jgi:hypothetical protein
LVKKKKNGRWKVAYLDPALVSEPEHTQKKSNKS